MKSNIAAIAFLCWSAADCSHAQTVDESRAADFFVATNGSDRWSGRSAQPDDAHTDGPFATIARARDAVRELKRGSTKKDFVVRFRGGRYPLAETLVFSLQDSAPIGGTITYAAYLGEMPVISSGVPIRNWRKLEINPVRLPAAARGKVWVADLPSVLDRFLTLYDGLGRLPRARGEGFAPMEAADKTNSAAKLTFATNSLREWPDLKEAELLVIPTADYEMSILPLSSVGEKTHVATTAFPASRPIGKVKFFPISAWAENAVDLLHRPGEWVLNTAERKVYLWPRTESPGDDVVAPKLTELVRVEGRIDYEGPRDEPVRGIVFRGLTFSHAERFQWHGYTGWSLQHHWEMFDRPTAALRFRGAEECVVQACRITATSGAAVRLDLHCRHNRIEDNEISQVGGVGILLAGYGPGAKDVNSRNEIINNWIHDTGEIYWASPAVMVWQSSENHIANNLIQHTPYSGITISTRSAWDPDNHTADGARTVRWSEVGNPKDSIGWNERERFLHSRKNLVERNDIQQVMEVLGDGDGIYISGAGGQNVIHENFIHDCDSDHMADGIRCDDFQEETTINGNVIYHIRRVGQGICSKGKNHILNNLVVDLLPSRLPIRPERVVRGYIGLEVNPVSGSRVERNILLALRPDCPPYIQDRRYGTGGEPRLRDCRADYNLYYCSADPAWGRQHLANEQRFGIELHSLSEDPLFVALDQGYLRLKAESPAFKLGFQPADLSRIGLRPSHPYFRRQ